MCNSRHTAFALHSDMNFHISLVFSITISPSFILELSTAVAYSITYSYGKSWSHSNTSLTLLNVVHYLTITSPTRSSLYKPFSFHSSIQTAKIQQPVNPTNAITTTPVGFCTTLASQPRSRFNFQFHPTSCLKYEDLEGQLL